MAMSEPFLLRLTPDEHEALRAKADEEERTMAQTLRRALRAYLEAGAYTPCGCSDRQAART